MTHSVAVQPVAQRVYTSCITAENRITGRCLRKWVAAGRFPSPDGNLNGRNFWLVSTYESWKAEVLAGRYSQRRRPGTVEEMAPPEAA